MENQKRVLFISLVTTHPRIETYLEMFKHVAATNGLQLFFCSFEYYIIIQLLRVKLSNKS